MEYYSIEQRVTIIFTICVSVHVFLLYRLNSLTFYNISRIVILYYFKLSNVEKNSIIGYYIVNFIVSQFYGFILNNKNYNIYDIYILLYKNYLPIDKFIKVIRLDISLLYALSVLMWTTLYRDINYVIDLFFYFLMIPNITNIIEDRLKSEEYYNDNILKVKSEEYYNDDINSITHKNMILNLSTTIILLYFFPFSSSILNLSLFSLIYIVNIQYIKIKNTNNLI